MLLGAKWQTDGAPLPIITLLHSPLSHRPKLLTLSNLQTLVFILPVNTPAQYSAPSHPPAGKTQIRARIVAKFLEYLGSRSSKEFF